MPTHKIPANGLTHFVRDDGDPSAPVAILLHGFPDSSRVWSAISPLLADAGYRIIAPDLRGFGQSDMAGRVADYDIVHGALPDVLGIMDSLAISKAHLVGHDFGAPVAWMAAAQYPDRFPSLCAMSVGHMRAYLNAGAEQKRRSFYILLHQFRGACEWLYRRNDWAYLRAHWNAQKNIDDVIADLSRPGRLTAGLNWYRANISLARILSPPPTGSQGEERVSIPTLGLWSDGEEYLVEEQMKSSGDYVDGPWHYECIDGASHWISLDAPATLARLLIDHWRSVKA